MLTSSNQPNDLHASAFNLPPPGGVNATPAQREAAEKRMEAEAGLVNASVRSNLFGNHTV